MAWRGHDSPPASPPRAGYEAGRPAEGPPRGYEAGGQDGLDDLAVAALATLPPQKAASILTKLRNKAATCAIRRPTSSGRWRTRIATAAGVP